MEAVIIIILTIVLCLALGWAVGKLPWQEWLEGITITFGCIAIGTLLTSCATPTPDYPALGDPEIITGGDIEFAMPIDPTPAPDAPIDLHMWARYDPNTNGVQEVGVEYGIGGIVQTSKLVIVCVDTVCHDAYTDETGYAHSKFDRTWGVGAVPFSACVTPDTEPVCLRASFVAVEVEE